MTRRTEPRPFRKLCRLKQGLVDRLEDLAVFLLDEKCIIGFCLGVLISIIYRLSYSTNDSCEPAYPFLALWRDRMWAYWEVRIWNKGLYDMVDRERGAGMNGVKGAVFDGATPSAPGGATLSDAKHSKTWWKWIIK